MLQVPSESYENRTVCSAFVQLSRNGGNEEKREAREDRVNFPSAWRPAGMSRHNQQRSVEEACSLLGGTHAMISVKPRIDFLKDLSTGFNMDVSAPHLVHKWFTGHSRPR